MYADWRVACAGDGIGPEISQSVKDIYSAAKVSIFGRKTGHGMHMGTGCMPKRFWSQDLVGDALQYDLK